ncbi:MAG: alpha/beta hydrolase [Proteobacteria bacterium]|nr:alpha/beta hydrolase [Pseudomonadota bacterium]
MRERRLDVGGLSLALTEWGDPAGSPVVVLHGLLDQGPSWEAVARGLPGFRVVAPDARGQGRSSHVGAGGVYHFADYVRDLDGVVQDLGGRVHLVGHSMGATVASMYAGIVPETVDRLVLIEGVGPPSEAPDAAVARFRRHLEQMRSPPTHRPIDGVPDGARRIRKTMPALSEGEAWRLARRVLDDGDSWTWDPLHRTRSPIAFDLDRYLAMLRRVTAPTRVVLGERSWYAGIDRLQERIDALRADVDRIPCGHNPHIECPETLAELIRAHLNSPNS